MSETLVAQLQSLRDRIANDPRSAEMFEADCDVLLDAISRIKADKLRQFVKDRASSTYTDRIAALEADLARARAECERLRADAERYHDFRHIILRSEDMWPPYIDDALQAMTVEEFDAAIDAARKEGT